jgi:hypothetical protein
MFGIARIVRAGAAALVLALLCAPVVSTQDAGGKPKPAALTREKIRALLADAEFVLQAPEQYTISEREQTLAALGTMGTLCRIEPRWIAQFPLKDNDRLIRIQAAETLNAFGPAALSALPNIIDGLSDKDPVVRSKIVAALVYICSGRRFSAYNGENRRLVTELRRMVKSEPDRDARRLAISMLGVLGPAANLAVPDLLEIAKQPKDPDRDGALQTLANIGPGAKKALPLFMELARQNQKLGNIAFGSLGLIAPTDKAALALVMDALRGSLPPAEVTPDNAGRRRAAVGALMSFGPAAEPALPLLIKALSANDIKKRDVSDEIRWIALATLQEIGAPAKEALPIATRLADDPETDKHVRVEARALVESLQ